MHMMSRRRGKGLQTATDSDGGVKEHPSEDGGDSNKRPRRAGADGLRLGDVGPMCGTEALSLVAGGERVSGFCGLPVVQRLPDVLGGGAGVEGDGHGVSG